MKDDFEKSLHFVLQAEGGFSDVPGDNGGATNKGITHLEYDAYRRARGLPPQSVRLIGDAEVEDIYRTSYWQAVRADSLPWPLDLIAFDTAVNMGVGAATLMLAEAEGQPAGVAADLPALAAKTPAQARAIAEEFLTLREARYRRIAEVPHDTQFLQGWLNRLAALRRLAGC